ncbi:hypothetical protein B5X24_HaOG211987 [Helicoverpa armigera]|uniref:Ig-like domain-containing protein n=1 Tax=Helicoverpa armigera TaxID=29058 RepID=A0A2W1BFN7_HELAM|nr:hypothetical protein B5X24_HaOG211987 [Helicoverpa armigera]
MKYLFPLILFTFGLCGARVVPATDSIVVPDRTDVKERAPLSYTCKFRTLQGGDAYPSVVVRWHGQIQRMTWDSAGEVTYEQNYVYPAAFHVYPSSDGLSGGSAQAPTDPFPDAPVIPDEYVFEDIVESFKRDCKRPY